MAQHWPPFPFEHLFLPKWPKMIHNCNLPKLTIVSHWWLIALNLSCFKFCFKSFLVCSKRLESRNDGDDLRRGAAASAAAAVAATNETNLESKEEFQKSESLLINFIFCSKAKRCFKSFWAKKQKASKVIFFHSMFLIRMCGAQVCSCSD